MNHSKSYMVRVALVVALSGFVWGFDATVISGAQQFLREYFKLTGDKGDFLLGLAVSCLGWGVPVGTAVAGYFSDRFGRKKVLLVIAVFFTVTSLLTALATHFWVFVVARFLGGVAVGGALVMAPVYIAEISLPRYRGSMVSLYQLMIVSGMSASFFSNYYLKDVELNNWRWMLAMDAVPASLFFLLLFAVPESPRWLFGRGQEGQARDILVRVGGTEQAEEELSRIQQSFAEKAPQARLAGLFGPQMRFILFIALVIAFLQQITGINAVFYYLPTIFAQTGGGIEDAFGRSVLVGLVNLGMTFVAIAFVDRLGRKPLLAIGATGMAIALLTCSWAFHDSSYQLTDQSFAVLENNRAPAELIADLRAADRPAYRSEKEYLSGLKRTLGADRVKAHKDMLVTAGLHVRSWLVLVAIMAFVASFAISMGPVVWVLLSEIFPNQYRGVAMSLVGLLNAATSASVTFIFPWELSHLGSAGTFLGYGLMAVATVVFVLMFVPETKGKSLEELETLLVRH